MDCAASMLFDVHLGFSARIKGLKTEISFLPRRNLLVKKIAVSMSVPLSF